jgi:hypothetical protein
MLQTDDRRCSDSFAQVVEVEGAPEAKLGRPDVQLALEVGAEASTG